MTDTIAKTKDYFISRDKADADLLKRDVEQAIAATVMQGCQRLVIFTNANARVVRNVSSQLDPRALHQINLSVVITNDSPQEEIKKRQKIANEDIPTLVVVSEIESAKQNLFFG